MWERIVTVIVRATPSFCLTCTRERLISILEDVWNERDNCAPGLWCVPVRSRVGLGVTTLRGYLALSHGFYKLAMDATISGPLVFWFSLKWSRSAYGG